jgi:putative NIF3 family GTP cyclohydrolase 1 type 2
MRILQGLRFGVLFLTCLATVKAVAQAPKPLTAIQVVDRIKKEVTTDWAEETVDTFKGGSQDMEVTGIATTFLATIVVLRKAKDANLNMVITHEPTFYNHFDDTATLEGDPVLKAKQDFIKENNMIVFRFHDHIHRTSPDGIYEGMVNEMDWKQYETKQRPYRYTIPETSLEKLAADLQANYTEAEIRVVGNPEMVVRKVGMVLGAAGSARQLASLQENDVEVLIIGETQEWETVEYVRDAVALGKNKALIILGHAISEEGGMQYCADWLSGFVTEVPVRFIPAGDPFWMP